MNVVDSSGWLEYFADGNNSDFFAPAILDAEELVVPSVIIYEVFKVLLRNGDAEDALEKMRVMVRGHIHHQTEAKPVN